MPFFSPGSSELTITATPSPAVIDKLAALSVDEPLPEPYKSDRIRLLAQSPHKLFLYWEFARDPFDALRRAFGAQAARYTLMVRLTEVEGGVESLHQASPTYSQWLDVQPGRSYRADVGLFAPGRAFIRLLSSNGAHTPRARAARSVDPMEQWSVSAEQFARVLDEAGYVSDALEVTLEAADFATRGEATRAIAGRFAGGATPAISDGELEELRGLLAALAFGISVDELRRTLSPPLARWIERTSGEMAGAFDAARLLETLRSTLGIEMSRTPFGAPTEAARRRAARTVLGASEVNLPSQPFHLWIPSMTAGILKGMRDEG